MRAVRRPAIFARRNTESNATSAGYRLLITPEAAGSRPEAWATRFGPLYVGNSARAQTSSPSARSLLRTCMSREASSRSPSTMIHTTRLAGASARDGGSSCTRRTAGVGTIRSLS